MISYSIAILLTINILLPIKCGNRNDISEIQLTHIGQFGVMRKAREGVPAHFHTGIDIKRPGKNYLILSSVIYLTLKVDWYAIGLGSNDD